ncbi:MAG: hypothetical protein JSS00_00970 [Proteobacteria bacterium]|nr:hypothetical protein [Pseudomonadota bacterium]
MDIAAACRDMFKLNAVEAFGGRFHVPCADDYPCLFAWDSGYHALALRNLDRAAAVSELATLYQANTTESGLLAHERPIPVAAERTQFVVDTIGPIYRPDLRSWLIDPPVAAFAAAELFDVGGDIGLLECASRHLIAIDRVRTFAPGELPVILHPLESGADASPLFDALVDVSSQNGYIAQLHDLSHALAACEGVLDRSAPSRHPFIVIDPIFCGWYLLALEAVASAWSRAGDEAKEDEFGARARSIAGQMCAHLWSERHVLFVGLDRVGRRRLDVATLGGIVAAASTAMAAAGFGSQVAATHLDLASSVFWGAAGIAFNPMGATTRYDEGMLWRGAVASGATQYWSWLVATRNGAQLAANRFRTQLLSLIEQSGFREFYDAQTGKGLGAGVPTGFTWPALVLDMKAPNGAAVDRAQQSPPAAT